MVKVLQHKLAGKVSIGTSYKMALSDLTTNNKFYEAVVVVDSLAKDQGGEGTDVLVGVEGLVFGHASSDNEGLDRQIVKVQI